MGAGACCAKMGMRGTDGGCQIQWLRTVGRRSKTEVGREKEGIEEGEDAKCRLMGFEVESAVLLSSRFLKWKFYLQAETVIESGKRERKMKEKQGKGEIQGTREKF
ncbi:hypothetical protein VNO77_18644 [Canavalia gladiata]|uniref:Uncharacterized protein n=1 Tax=Canavalia gladiata TaxID=3824 RepID=A0AAN9LQ32_CANGL